MDRSVPFFSILIPSYNRPEDLRRCILSVLKDPFSDYEIIVSDDNSPKKNEVIEVISSFGQLEKLRFYSQSENLKEPENKNFLVRSATGKYNIIIGDDDTLTENALTNIYNFIGCNVGHDIYGLGYNIVDEHSFMLSTHKAPTAVTLNCDKTRRLILEAGSLPMTIFHPATFCCRAGLELAIPYRTDIGIGEDLCFIFESVITDKSICIIPEALFNWRKVQDIKAVTQGNQSAERLASFKSKILIYEVIKKLLFSDQGLAAYVNSYKYRRRFLYIELLRDKNFKALASSKVSVKRYVYNELHALNTSRFWNFRLRFIRFTRLYELTQIFGILQTTLMMKNYFMAKLGDFSMRREGGKLSAK